MTLKEFIEKQDWKFAKTYAAFAPHEYIVRGKQNGTDEEFLAFADAILEHGIRMFYYKTERKYLYYGGRFYWICWNGREEGKPVSDDPTAVINRCLPEQYDIVFVRKNSWLNSKKAKELEENVQLELDLEQMK